MIVPPTGAIIGHREKESMHEAVERGWLTTDKFNTQFESMLSKFLGAKYVLTCNSGSSSNLLAFMALTSEKLGERRLRPGDEVITVAAGFPTTINPIIQAGCIPVFCDVTIPEYNIDVNQLRSAHSRATKAVVLAHTLGTPFNVAFVRQFCDENCLWLIEDCCDALGNFHEGKHFGTFGDLGTLSFFPAHHITTGEGGAVFTNSSKLKRVVESIRDWGRDCWCPPGTDNTCKKRFAQQHGDLPHGYDHKYTYTELGYNLKLTEIAAACGVAQMESLGWFIEKRHANYQYLWHGLHGLQSQLILPTFNVQSPFGFPITVKHHDRHSLIEHLDACQVGTRLLFGGNLTKQPYMKNREYRIASTLVNTDRIMHNSFWIGCHPALSKEQLDHSIKSIKEYFE